MSESGAPVGNSNAKKGTEWRQAIKKALASHSKGQGASKGLEMIAKKLVEAAANGDQWAIREIGDRQDGKPSQTVDMNVTEYSHEAALDELENG